MEFMQMAPGLYLGGQPNVEDLKNLKQKGITTVIDVREPSETDMPNHQLVQDIGLEYINIPVTKETFTDAKVDHFRTVIEEHPTNVLVHCASGVRAGAMMMMIMAIRQNWSSRDALEHASKMGFDCDAEPKIKAFFVEYIDRHTVS
jgi:uncharacterized protein (TIGR01244 family)